MAAGWKDCDLKRLMADTSASVVRGVNSMPFCPSWMISSLPPSPKAITGVPAASASIMTIPKSSLIGNKYAFAPANNSVTRSSDGKCSKVIVGPAIDFSRSWSGPPPLTINGSLSSLQALMPLVLLTLL